MKIRPVGAELFRADGRTDMKKLTVAFSNFANEPKNQTVNVVKVRTCSYFFKSLSYVPQSGRHNASLCNTDVVRSTASSLTVKNTLCNLKFLLRSTQNTQFYDVSGKS